MKKLFPNFFSCIFDVCYALANFFDVAVVLSDRRKFHFWRNTYDFKQFSIIFSAEIDGKLVGIMLGVLDEGKLLGK